MWAAGCCDGFGVRLGQAACHQSPEEVPHDDSSHVAVGFLQGHKAPESQRLSDVSRHFRVCYLACHRDERLGGVLIVEHESQGFCCGPDGPGAAPFRARRKLVSSWLAGRSGSGCGIRVG